MWTPSSLMHCCTCHPFACGWTWHAPSYCAQHSWHATQSHYCSTPRVRVEDVVRREIYRRVEEAAAELRKDGTVLNPADAEQLAAAAMDAVNAVLDLR